MSRLLWSKGLLAASCCSWSVQAPAPAVYDPPSERYDSLILSYSQRRGLNPSLVKAMIAVESQFTPGAVSPVGARGLMQVMPSTADELGVPRCRLRDAEANIAAGTRYLGLLDGTARARFGIPRGRPMPLWLQKRVVASYHGGPRNLEPRLWADSTRAYVKDVFRLARSRRCSLRPSRRNC